MQLWGGIECTVNRVRDDYFDQMEWNGHSSRISDLDRIAALGIRTLRYPVLWERVAPLGLKRADWSWPDERLSRLREFKIRPIVGLLHHGSGPRDTGLLDPDFPEKLAEYAAAVAERYPWVDLYTPVNEPLTTARFSCLYGHWYPHRSDARSFLTALINQIKATVLAMRAIKGVNPQAGLLQTEDLGKVHSTPALSYQAAHENERRWLSLDLLTGKVGPSHPLFSYIRKVLRSGADLEWFQGNATKPRYLGFNHYLSSERYLDERTDLYPSEPVGGNGLHSYVDVLAARVLPKGAFGLEMLLGEAWERYEIPIVISEVHNGCTREEQLRWLRYVWDSAKRASLRGVRIEACTIWAMFGSFDWDRLLTCPRGQYEAGAFDVRSPAPRATALAAAVSALAQGKDLSHPLLGSPGWWLRPERLCYLGGEQ